MDCFGNVNSSEQNFGIKRIVDCRMGQDGKPVYQVKWHMTWEPAESLADCQHLLDQFWDRINGWQKEKSCSSKSKKRKVDDDLSIFRPDSNVISPSESCRDEMSTNQNFYKPVGSASKNDNLSRNAVQLAEQRSDFAVGVSRPSSSLPPAMAEPGTRTPVKDAAKIRRSKAGGIEEAVTPPKSRISQSCNAKSSPSSSAGTKQETGSIKIERPDSVKGDEQWSSPDASKFKSTSDCLKLLDAFQNEYVRIVLVCSVCGKEQNSKKPALWKVHWLTHSDTKPFYCSVCGKGFVQSNNMVRHMKTHSKNEETAEDFDRKDLATHLQAMPPLPSLSNFLS